MRNKGVPLRILIVDDEPLIRFVLTKFLQKRFDVKAVTTAEEALSEIASQHYDLCFLDVILPGMTGLDALRIINQLSPTTKVAIMTGNSFDKAALALIKDLSCAFIEKPFNLSEINELADRVAAALPMQHMAGGSTG